jgi:predicted lipid-binding transport protein (Tim44 family)
MRRMGLVSIIVAVLLSVAAAHIPEAWARAGGGGGRSGGGSSIGSRGSRSTTAPVSPAPATPTSPSRTVAPAPAPVQAQRPSFFRNIMGGIAGFAIGGLIGSMLFGHGGFGGGFGGIGMFDILLIGGAIVLLVMFLRRRRTEQTAPAYGQASSYGQQPAYAMAGGQPGYDGPTSSAIEMEPPAQTVDLERGLAHIRQMDPAFDPARLVTWARGVYLDVQNSMKSRELNGLRERLAPEIAAELQAQCDRLRGARQTNVVERIDLRRTDITEAWQETGRDYVTVYFAASMLDYTTDDSSGAVVQGSKTEPQDVEDFWTFTRPVGSGPWQLSAIQNV